MKFKPCCNRRCLLANCEVRNEGGCKCLCSLFDQLHSLESVEDGHTFMSAGAYIYYPNKEDADAKVEKMTDEQKKEHFEFFDKLGDFKKNVLEKIKRYEIKS